MPCRQALRDRSRPARLLPAGSRRSSASTTRTSPRPPPGHPSWPTTTRQRRVSTSGPSRPRSCIAQGTIAGVKQASTSVADVHALLAAGVPVWIANSTLNTAALAMGARGSISTLTNVVPELFVALYRAIGDCRPRPRARSSRRTSTPLGEGLRHPIIGALHAGATMRGLPGGAPRSPLRLPTAGEMEAIRDVVAGVSP